MKHCIRLLIGIPFGGMVLFMLSIMLVFLYIIEWAWEERGLTNTCLKDMKATIKWMVK